MNTVLKEGVFGEPLVALHRWAYRLGRTVSQHDRQIINQYFAQRQVRKLQLGCGNNCLEDWLNSDFYPKSPGVVHLDATGRFPFADGTFDYVFSEHMIEHVTFPQGLSLLKESYRVLKDGGRIRISTPDLAFLIALCGENKSEIQKVYIERSSRDCGAPFAYETFVVNNFVRAWKHTFIYDQKVLCFSLEQAGFCEICKVSINESEVAEFRNLENERRSPEGFIRLETLAVEGTKRATH